MAIAMRCDLRPLIPRQFWDLMTRPIACIGNMCSRVIANLVNCSASFPGYWQNRSSFFLDIRDRAAPNSGDEGQSEFRGEISDFSFI